MACACHKCICVISISIFSACLFKTPYFDCYNKFYIIKYSLRNQFINNKKSLSVFLCYIYKRCLNYHTPSRYLCKYIYLNISDSILHTCIDNFSSSEILNQSNNPEIITFNIILKSRLKHDVAPTHLNIFEFFVQPHSVCCFRLQHFRGVGCCVMFLR